MSRSPVPVSAGTREFLLALADDKHLMGQQHAEWIGVTPFLEEDLAFCSIGQDELGHAALLYALLDGDDDHAIDALAYDRGAEAYRSCHLVEFFTDDWTLAFARHWLFDTADRYRWDLLAESSLPELAAIAARVAREESFHQLHAQQMVQVLIADDSAKERLTAAVQTLAAQTLGLFEPTEGEADAISEGIVSAPFLPRWEDFRTEIEASIGEIDWGAPPDQNGRKARSGDWQALMDRMREVIDLDPQATW